MSREAWTRLSDAELLAHCAVDTYRASGPGGQKRNKTSSAVRLRHQASGLIVIAEESRSQHENKARALRRLRERMYLKIRAMPNARQLAALSGLARLGRRDRRFWPAVAVVLDLLSERKAQVAEVAGELGLSTGQLVTFLEREATVWTQVNELRRQFGHRPLR